MLVIGFISQHYADFKIKFAFFSLSLAVGDCEIIVENHMVFDKNGWHGLVKYYGIWSVNNPGLTVEKLVVLC